MDPAVVLQQADVLVSRELDFEPALPLTLWGLWSLTASFTTGQYSASPSASAFGFMGAFLD